MSVETRGSDTEDARFEDAPLASRPLRLKA